MEHNYKKIKKDMKLKQYEIETIALVAKPILSFQTLRKSIPDTISCFDWFGEKGNNWEPRQSIGTICRDRFVKFAKLQKSETQTSRS
mgnify:CR=1 FL=1